MIIKTIDLKYLSFKYQCKLKSEVEILIDYDNLPIWCKYCTKITHCLGGCISRQGYGSYGQGGQHPTYSKALRLAGQVVQGPNRSDPQGHAQDPHNGEETGWTNVERCKGQGRRMEQENHRATLLAVTTLSFAVLAALDEEPYTPTEEAALSPAADHTEVDMLPLDVNVDQQGEATVTIPKKHTKKKPSSN